MFCCCCICKIKRRNHTRARWQLSSPDTSYYHSKSIHAYNGRAITSEHFQRPQPWKGAMLFHMLSLAPSRASTDNLESVRPFTARQIGVAYPWTLGLPSARECGDSCSLHWISHNHACEPGSTLYRTNAHQLRQFSDRAVHGSCPALSAWARRPVHPKGGLADIFPVQGISLWGWLAFSATAHCCWFYLVYQPRNLLQTSATYSCRADVTLRACIRKRSLQSELDASSAKTDNSMRSAAISHW